jgi:large subunit ribosomal protein L23
MAMFNFLKKTKPVQKKKNIEPEVIKKAPSQKNEGPAFKLLKEPHISEKATSLSENGKYVFKVYKNANKSEIKKTVSNLYGVIVKDVNIVNIKTKIKLLRGKKGEKSGYKKAIITLEKGHKIEILPH